MLQFHTLKNGLRVLLVPFEGTQTATTLVLCKVGSRYEGKKINGAAHFIEHLLFKGTKRRPNTLEITRTLDAVGAEFNAYTGKDVTGYYVKSDSKHVALGVDLLHDILFHSKFDPKEMVRERRVIVEELNMYHDNPMMHVDELLEAAAFPENTLGWEIGGSRETVLGMPRKDVLAFRDAYYHPSRMVLCIAGKIPEGTLSLVKETFGKGQATGKKPAPDFARFASPGSTQLPRVKLQYKKTKQMQVAFGFPGVALDDPTENAVELLSVILGGTMSSRLFVSVRERRGLAYLVRASHGAYEDAGLFTIQAGLDTSRLKLACRVIRSEWRKICKEGVTARELAEAKENVCGKSLLRQENSSAQAEWNAREMLFHNRQKTLEQYLQELRAVTQKEVQQAAKIVFDERQLAIGVVGPFKTPAAFLKAAGMGGA